MKPLLSLLAMCLAISRLNAAPEEVWKDGMALRHYVLTFEKVEKNETLTAEEARTAIAGAAYLKGWLDSYSVMIGRSNQVFKLPPEGVSVGQVTLILRKWIDKHPEGLNEPSMVIVLAALYEAFPNNDPVGK